MSNITDWTKYELYPSLYQRIDTALPEHSFKRFAGGWRSATTLDGSPHERADKTVVSKQAPHRILEQGGDTLSLIDYVMRRDRVEFIQAVKTLAEAVGLKLPKGDFDQESYQSYRERATIWEDCSSYFKSCLQEDTPGAKEVKAYLTETRGYSDSDVTDMELGYIPSQKELSKHLLSRGHNQSLIDETVKLNTGIGTTHKLTIPYRSGGSLKGFKFRTVVGVTPKYLNSTGLDRLGGFFNISGLEGDKDVVIVEGELDSLSATAKGIHNVVATGGSSISSDQVRDAIRRGAKSFTLCFDYEPGKEKEEATAKRVNKAIEVILGEGVNRVYVVSLPGIGEGKTDPDGLIKESGVEAFKGAIKEAFEYYRYWLQETLHRYGSIEEAAGELQSRDIDRLLDEVVETASQIPDPVDKDRYTKLFTSLEVIKDLGITEESLSITVDRLTSTRDREAQAKDFKKLLTEATQLQDRGETEKALELISSRVREVQLRDKATEFSGLMIPMTEEGVRERLSNKPESVDSGYEIENEPLLLPSGAISIFVAPTSHGKTTLLLNLALNVVKANKDKQFYFFSYEEDGDSILVNALNTYQGKSLSKNNRRSIKSYLVTGSTEFMASEQREDFIASKESFFKELIETKRLSIHYTSYNIEILIEAIRYLKKYANPGAIFIDYMQLLNLPSGKYETYSRQQEMKVICIALKDLAVETGLPIVVGAQFNREVVSVNTMHATHISEAGDIERIANLIVGFWNNNFEQKREQKRPLKNAKTDGEEVKANTLSVMVLKNREGRANTKATLAIDGNAGSISNRVSQAFSHFR